MFALDGSPRKDSLVPYTEIPVGTAEQQGRSPHDSHNVATLVYSYNIICLNTLYMAMLKSRILLKMVNITLIRLTISLA